ncbi:precorrin-2/cobalt-factor-2 C20-methyltransferase [Cetobacterium ceti]|uniref:Precorrin-2/cobalt-factor-2 C20-methyltransferase n=1 Tax=Cetobacterium ceti TaxID=180163 RepID=A0A1T4LD20_9FUSO|nr:precorrin-2/cobalt-factor-2 C20-methyltransferase [Cetobacterium ceti]
MATFYGIGVGVGDPEMITLKAINALKDLDVVILPEAKKDEGSTAYSIAKEYLREDIEELFLEFPMISDVEKKKKIRRANAEKIEEYLEAGKNIGFLTIGDPMTFSTYVYVLEYLSDKYSVKTIPGVSSFVDMASRFNFPLVMGDESLKIISLHGKVDIKKEIENSDNIVFMKVTRSFDDLKAALIATNNMENIILVSNCGKENQEVFFNIENLQKEDVHYFSTLILKKGGINQWKKFIS